MRHEAMFLRHGNLAQRKGSAPTSRTTIRALPGWGKQVSRGSDE